MKISIIVPVYNIYNYVSYCIQSLICQDYPNIEIILVDDGSKDQSSQLCDKFAKSSNKIKVIHKQNGGLSSARNAGITIATGDYILFIDGDDYLDNGTLTTLAYIAKSTKAEVIQYGYEEVPSYYGLENAKKKTRCKELKYEIITDRHKFYERLYSLGGLAASSCTKLIQSELVKSLLFKENILHEDEEFTTRLLAKCNNIVYITDYTPYKYVMREGSIIHSNFNPKRIFDISEIYEERMNVLRNLDYIDLLDITASKYFSLLMLHYEAAYKANNIKVCKYIDKKAQYIASKYRLKLSTINKVLAYIYKFNKSGAAFYYTIKKIIKTRNE